MCMCMCVDCLTAMMVLQTFGRNNSTLLLLVIFNRQTDRHTDTQTHRHTHRHTDRHTDTHTDTHTQSRCLSLTGRTQWAVAKEIISMCWAEADARLRDELFVQLCKQTTGNTKMYVCCLPLPSPKHWQHHNPCSSSSSSTSHSWQRAR